MVLDNVPPLSVDSAVISSTTPQAAISSRFASEKIFVWVGGLGGVMLSTMNKKLGQAIRNARLQAGLSLRQASEATGVDHAYLPKLESGEREPSIRTLEKLAKGYATSVLAILKQAGLK